MPGLDAISEGVKQKRSALIADDSAVAAAAAGVPTAIAASIDERRQRRGEPRAARCVVIRTTIPGRR